MGCYWYDHLDWVVAMRSEVVDGGLGFVVYVGDVIWLSLVKDNLYELGQTLLPVEH